MSNGQHTGAPAAVWGLDGQPRALAGSGIWANPSVRSPNHDTTAAEMFLLLKCSPSLHNGPKIKVFEFEACTKYLARFQLSDLYA